MGLESTDHTDRPTRRDGEGPEQTKDSCQPVLLGGYIIGSLSAKRADDDSDGQLWSKLEIKVGKASAARSHKSF